MRLIPIANLPNQSLSVSVDNIFYDIRLKQIASSPKIVNGVVLYTENVIMASSIIRNNILIQEGIRIVPGLPLMPFLFQENNEGNFFLTTANDDYPDYQQFGISQFLYYLTQSELQAVRSAENEDLYGDYENHIIASILRKNKKEEDRLKSLKIKTKTKIIYKRKKLIEPNYA